MIIIMKIASLQKCKYHKMFLKKKVSTECFDNVLSNTRVNFTCPHFPLSLSLNLAPFQSHFPNKSMHGTFTLHVFAVLMRAAMLISDVCC